MPANARAHALTGGNARHAVTMWAGAALAACLLAPVAARTAPPEYHKLGLRTGQAIEVSGRLDARGFFVASDLQRLPDPRRPKLRAEIAAVDAGAGVMTVLGRRIALEDDTEYEGCTRASLRSGLRLEVSCKVEDDGRWVARSIACGQVKASDKVKGTITSMQYDGQAPDTLSISGLLVLLDGRTDLDEASALRDRRDEALFAVLSARDASAIPGARVLADGRMGLVAQYRHNLELADELDLTSRYESDLDDMQPELRLRWSGFWTSALRTHVEARARRHDVLDSDLGEADDEAELHLVQAWALWQAAPRLPLALAVGRQDFDEDREWLYDEYLDAVRVAWLPADDWSVQASWIHAIEPLKEKSATWTDVLLVADHWLDKRNRVSAWMLARSDSDELRRREPLWAGLRYLGEPRRDLSAWVELARMTGEDKHEPLDAWALDLGGTFRLDATPGSPALTVGYALGSGDDTGGDGTDGTFRQTGYQDNSARLGGLTAAYYYGGLLNPELANLRVLTVGAAVRPLRDASLELLWHRYDQDALDDDLKGDLVDPPARPNGASTGLGWGLDFIVTAPRLWESVRGAWTVGVFEPGEAFAPRRDRAVMHRINITVEL